MDTLVISNILLWIGFLAMIFVNIALARQIGVLNERVAPAGALLMNQNLRVGSSAPKLTLNSIDKKIITIGGKSSNKKYQLLFFISPDCPMCKKLLPAIKAASLAETKWLDVIFASDGEKLNHQGYVHDNRLNDPYVVSELLGRSYGVSKLPYAVLISATGKITSMGIVNSREHIDSLFEAKEHNVTSLQAYIQNN